MLLAIAGKLENFQENLKPRLSLWEERDGGRFKFSMRLNFTSLILRRSWSCMLDTSDLERSTPNDYDTFFMDRRTFFLRSAYQVIFFFMDRRTFSCELHVDTSFFPRIYGRFSRGAYRVIFFFMDRRMFPSEMHDEFSFSRNNELFFGIFRSVTGYIESSFS